MRTYRIAEVLKGTTTDRVVLITNEDGTEYWGTMHPTESAARLEADRLTSLTLDTRDGADPAPSTLH